MLRNSGVYVDRVGGTDGSFCPSELLQFQVEVVVLEIKLATGSTTVANFWLYLKIKNHTHTRTHACTRAAAGFLALVQQLSIFPFCIVCVSFHQKDQSDICSLGLGLAFVSPCPVKACCGR